MRLRSEDARSEDDTLAPPTKRRRKRGAEGVVSRPPSELRESLELLYTRLQGGDDGDAVGVADDDLAVMTSEMVVIRAKGATSERKFRCMRSLLASASQPFRTMLYGHDSLQMVESEQSEICLQGVEPDMFQLLLSYLHGKMVPLDEHAAISLYTLADFYDVTSLRDGCCELLEACLQPAAICRWLAQARQLGCVRLTRKCLEILQTDLMNVEAEDPAFASISEEDIALAVQSSAVICTGEADVWEVVQRWASGRTDCAQALERLAPHVRWPLMDVQTLEALQLARASRSTPRLAPFLREALAYKRASKEEKEAMAMGERVQPRRYFLGELVVFDRLGVPSEEARALKPGDEFTVGRSRKSDIIFPNPFVSSTHCRVYSDEVGEGASRELEVKLRDVSSNGSFLNAELVGKDKVVSLKHGDRISVVRPPSAGVEPGAVSIGYILFRQLARMRHSNGDERAAHVYGGADNETFPADADAADESEHPVQPE